MEISPSSHVLSAMRDGSPFSLDSTPGEFDRNAFAQSYGDMFEELLSRFEYEKIEIDVEDGGIRVTAFNADGSFFDLGFSVNDRLGINADYLTGVSVDHGNEVSLDWLFTDNGDLTPATLTEFVECFKVW